MLFTKHIEDLRDLGYKSAKGLLRVECEDGRFVLYDEQTEDQERQSLLNVVYQDGVFSDTQTFEEIKSRM